MRHLENHPDRAPQPRKATQPTALPHRLATLAASAGLRLPLTMTALRHRLATLAALRHRLATLAAPRLRRSVPSVVTLRHRFAAQTAAFVLVFAAFALAPLAQAATSRPDRYPSPDRYKERIDLWVVQDKEATPSKGGIVFTGSSTITRWNDNLAKDFEGFTVLGRGFGGSVIADSVHFADKTVIPHAPRQIVFYAGENDIASNLPPQGVLEDFQTFVEKVKGELPDVQILYVSMKPSPLRWNLQPQFDEANALIKAYCEATDGLEYVDIKTALLGEDGQPRENLYVQDRLHLNAEGYKILQRIIEPLLLPEAPAKGGSTPQTDGKGKPATKKDSKQKDHKKGSESTEMML